MGTVWSGVFSAVFGWMVVGAASESDGKALLTVVVESTDRLRGKRESEELAADGDRRETALAAGVPRGRGVGEVHAGRDPI